jgi:hypothetical protein
VSNEGAPPVSAVIELAFRARAGQGRVKHY